jgi:hypothetical protein
MLKRFTFWLWAAGVFQLLTALIHSVGLFIALEPQNDTERQLDHLMSSYRMDMGGGFNPSMENLFTALSSCFSFLCLLGGLTTLLLLRKKAPLDIIRGSVKIHILVFGACFAVMAFFTFLPPIVMTGLIFISLIIALVLMPSVHQAPIPQK